MSQAAIYYEAEGYVTSVSKLMGRQAAGEGFLRAAAQSGVTSLACHATSQQEAQLFAQQVAGYGFKGDVRWVKKGALDEIADAGCLYLPGPAMSEFAWHRRSFGETAYSLCGVTHTTASHGAMSAITSLLTAPLHHWDALICTSNAVVSTVKYLLESQQDYLRYRLGATQFEQPQLPMIPLGAHCDDYVFSERDKVEARRAIGAAPEEVVVLFVGRLSFHAKAHPFQLYTALQRVGVNRSIRMVQCGWFANTSIEAAFKDGAQHLCPSIKATWLDGRQAEHRRQAWAAADVFVSLADNIQETFGLTPIEAMAAGLPVVVSDWDGYKDTVREGIDGFRIATIMPPEPLGDHLSRNYELGIDSYDMYCGYASQFVALDANALVAALEVLIVNPGKRRAMGEEGRKRARQDFDWSVIYRRYQELWQELGHRRQSEPAIYSANALPSRPDRPDPFAAFSSYPSTLLSDGHYVTLLADIEESTLQFRRGLAMNQFAKAQQLSNTQCHSLLSLLSDFRPHSVQELEMHFPIQQRAAVRRGLVWLAKMEIVRLDLHAPGKI